MSSPLRSGVSAVLHYARTRQAAAGAVILGYHDVVAAPCAENWSVTIDAFAEHLAVLRRLGLTIVDLASIVERHAEGRSLDGLAAITFDDALLGVHELALPVLASEGCTATIFVVSGTHGVDPPWWPGVSRTMTTSELADAARAGFRLAAHTRSHRSLPSLDDDALRDELAGCRSDVGGLTTEAVELLAYPSGHHDVRVRRAARDCGYVAGFTFLNGRVVGSEDPFLLPRFTVGQHMSRLRLAYQLLRPSTTWPDHQLDQVLPDA